jgi:hypothetical protein
MSAATPAAGASPVDHSLRHILIIGGIVVALVVVAVAVVIVLGSRGAATYPPDSPEASFQAYLQAYEANDLETAYGYLSVRIRSDTALSAYLDEAAMYDRGDMTRGVWIDSVDRTGGRATLNLTIEEFYSSGLSSSSYRYESRVRMVLEDGSWRIDERLAGVDPVYR